MRAAGAIAPGLRAADYRNMIIALRNQQEVRLQDVAQVIDSVQDTRTRGMFNGQPAIVVNITQQPTANLIETADAIDALLPQLREQLPSDIELHVAVDRTGSVRASVREVEITLVIAVLLVVGVVGLFLRTLRAALIPAVATVVSLLGTLGVMYVLGFSLNNLTLMALTVATGFVVDDAIVVLENITRHLEQGVTRRRAALQGARGRLHGADHQRVAGGGVHSAAVHGRAGGAHVPRVRRHAVGGGADFAADSLTTTPMLRAVAAPAGGGTPPRQSVAGRLRQRLGGWARGSQRSLTRAYAGALDWALASPWLVVAVLLVVIGLNGYLFSAITKGFFPDQDNGLMTGGLRADQSISSGAMADKLQQAVDILRADPSVGPVVAFSGGWRSGGGFLSAALKPPGQRPPGRARAPSSNGRADWAHHRAARVSQPGAGAAHRRRSSNSSYQYTLKTDNQADLRNGRAACPSR